MLELLKRLAYGYWRLLDGSARDATEAWDNRDWTYLFLNVCIILSLLSALIGGGLLGLLFMWKIRGFLLAILLPPILLAIFIASYYENRKPHSKATSISDSTDVDIELARQRGLEMQDYVISFMFRVLVAISPFTQVIRPHSERDIEVHTRDGSSFYMKDSIIIYQAEAEVEGEVTPEVEEIIRREVQRYGRKYIVEYPMLISPEAGGHAPVEILTAKSFGSRVLIDFVFTTAASIPMIEARRRARIERQKRVKHITQYTDEDYGE